MTIKAVNLNAEQQIFDIMKSQSIINSRNFDKSDFHSL